MTAPGPQLTTLTRRLADTPEDFFAPLHVAAVVNDVAAGMGARLPDEALQRIAAETDANRIAVTALLAWLLADDWFAAARPAGPALLELLTDAAAELAATARAQKFTTDPERREELARVVQARLGYRPADETPEQAVDRLAAISGMERRRLLQASHAAERRAREIREALARKAAEEAADKWSRE